MTLPEAEPHLSFALEAAVARFGTMVRQVGRRYRLDESGLGEVMQEVRIRLWRAEETSEQVGETDETDTSYVYRTASSAALDVLRRRRARQTDRHAAIAACSSPEAVLAVIRREGSEDSRLATLDHVMSCAECRSELDLLRSIELAGAAAGAEAGANARPGRRSWLVPAALAASVLLAVVLGRLALPTAPESEVVRSGSVGGVTLLAPPPESPAGSPLLFAWQPIPGAGRYRLEVLTNDGEVALEAETADTAITLPSAAGLAPGDYKWWVGATSAAATARSALRPLRLTAR